MFTLAYFFLGGQPSDMDPDGDSVPCEDVYPEDVIEAVWAGGIITPEPPVGQCSWAGSSLAVAVQWSLGTVWLPPPMLHVVARRPDAAPDNDRRSGLKPGLT